MGEQRMPFWLVAVSAFVFAWFTWNSAAPTGKQESHPSASQTFCGDHNALACAAQQRKAVFESPQPRSSISGGDYVGLLIALGVLSAAFVFVLHNLVTQRNGDWWAYTSPWTGHYWMRRRVGERWEYRIPTGAEVDEHHEGGHPI
jgi:hypothetical protein